MLIFYLVLSIGVSFLCSLFEAVLLSVPPVYVAALADRGSRGGKLLKEIKEGVDDSLAAILTLNTVAHTIGAAGVGAEVVRLYGDTYLALGSAILTLLVLVFSEIIPKTIGASNAKSLAVFAAYGIKIFIYCTYPFVFCFKGISKLIGGGGHLSPITRDEVRYTAELGMKEGSLTEEEASIIGNILRIREIQVKDVMTPRTVVFALDANALTGNVIEENDRLTFSRMPVYRGSQDTIVGIVFRYELVSAVSDGKSDIPISELMHPIHAVSDATTLARVFHSFIKRKEHLFAVHDEHGGFEGVITLEDVIETLLGVEITDEFDSVTDMRELARRKWEERQKRNAIQYN